MASALHVSVSQIKSFIMCPRRYQLHYVLGIKPEFLPAALVFGSAFHVALGYFYGVLLATKKAPPLDELVSMFTDAWNNGAEGAIPLQAEDEDASVDHVAKGSAMLGAIYQQVAAQPPEVISVEQPFSVDLFDSNGELLEEKLLGVFDLVVQEGEKKIVVEHKTSARKYSDDQLQYDLQLSAYKLAARQIGLGEVGLRYQIVTKTKTPGVQIVDVNRNGSDELDFMKTAIGVLRAIDAQAFYPVRGWQCRGCQFGLACRGAT